MHIKLILNMFSAKAKTRKTFGFPRSRARSHGTLMRVVACTTTRGTNHASVYIISLTVQK